jgi:predicted RNA-binding Zn-ribbon protein involved in translation (DUF1610 family)
MLKNVSMAIDDDVMGAGNVDPKDRDARINGITELLCDYVYEQLFDDDISYGTVIDLNVFRHIEWLVAAAMIAQYDWDAELWDKRIAGNATPRLLSDCPACGGQIAIPQRNDGFSCDECGAELVREVRIATKDEKQDVALMD